MKKQVLILLTLATAFTINGQSNLEFNQTLNLNINGAGYTVPDGKTWKITSASHVTIKVDGIDWPTIRKEIWGGNISITNNLPIWVSEGKTISWTDNNYISVLEFNVVPVSSTSGDGSSNSTSAATNSFGNLVPTSEPNSSIPSIFDSPKVFTTGGNWIVPPGVTNILVEAWGQGGKGGDDDNGTFAPQGTGGGGGGYGYESLEVIPGGYYTILIESSGTGLKLTGSNEEFIIFVGAGGDGTDTSDLPSDWTSNCSIYVGEGGISNAEFNISGENGGCINGGNGWAGCCGAGS